MGLLFTSVSTQLLQLFFPRLLVALAVLLAFGRVLVKVVISKSKHGNSHSMSSETSLKRHQEDQKKSLGLEGAGRDLADTISTFS